MALRSEVKLFAMNVLEGTLKKVAAFCSEFGERCRALVWVSAFGPKLLSEDDTARSVLLL